MGNLQTRPGMTDPPNTHRTVPHIAVEYVISFANRHARTYLRFACGVRGLHLPSSADTMAMEPRGVESPQPSRPPRSRRLAPFRGQFERMSRTWIIRVISKQRGSDIRLLEPRYRELITQTWLYSGSENDTLRIIHNSVGAG